MARPIDREKRRDLAERAVDALQKLGLEASMTQLAAELGVKRPTLLYHFPNRAAIVEAALGEILAKQALFIIERMERHEHPIDQLYAQIRGVYEFHYGNEARVLFLSQMVAMAGAERTARIIEIGNLAFEARRQEMARRLRRAIAAGTVVDHDVDSLIRVVRSFNDGLTVQRMMTGCDLEPVHAFIWKHVLSPLKIAP